MTTAVATLSPPASTWTGAVHARDFSWILAGGPPALLRSLGTATTYEACDSITRTSAAAPRAGHDGRHGNSKMGLTAIAFLPRGRGHPWPSWGRVPIRGRDRLRRASLPHQ